ncbi:hypothetical protein KFK09_006683 [Dendrobium nobile]|uniref:Uncharacterized protein n=1 Tax=Dendrobium nobile TaxID=94219 RepID=A0A8T3BUA6_DENNO|nr:hypothetical protein KFK09_006683 [Dendrobium nobile]
MGCAASKQEKKRRPSRGQIKARSAKILFGCASPKACRSGDGNDNACNDCIGVGGGGTDDYYMATDCGRMPELKSNN